MIDLFSIFYLLPNSLKYTMAAKSIEEEIDNMAAATTSNNENITEALRSLGKWLGANEKIRDQFELIIMSLSEDLKKLDERAGSSDAKLEELNAKVLELEMRVMAQKLDNLELRTRILEGKSARLKERLGITKQQIEDDLIKSDS